jgi:hypothetical protein
MLEHGDSIQLRVCVYQRAGDRFTIFFAMRWISSVEIGNRAIVGNEERRETGGPQGNSSFHPHPQRWCAESADAANA